MFVLHAVWSEAALHLWGNRFSESAGSQDRAIESPMAGSPDDRLGVPHDELRRSVGDIWDSLIISGATNGSLQLRLPYQNGPPTPSATAGATKEEDAVCELVSYELPTLRFGPADAVDLLTSTARHSDDSPSVGASLRFWSKAASLVQELLATQRFVPAVHLIDSHHFRGFWRVVVSEAHTTRRLRALIVSMPPICRAMVTQNGPVQAAALIENFLWTTVDALVRRCMHGDELAHALMDKPSPSPERHIAWLQSLVGENSQLQGSSTQQQIIFERVNDWLAKLDPSRTDRAYKTCFKLHAPERPATDQAQLPAQTWRLTVHVQATQDPRLVLDAHTLQSADQNEPSILDRPFLGALQQLRLDLQQAATHFPPLQSLSDDGPIKDFDLTTDQAHRFLCEAAPLLKAEGFGVWLPKWWSDDRTKLRMQLEITPASGDQTHNASVGLDTLVSYNWRVALGDEALSHDELRELAARQAPLIQMRGQWLEVQPSDLQTAMQFLEKHSGANISVLEALRLGYIADDFETGLPVDGLHARGWIDTLLHAGNNDSSIEPVPVPAGFNGKLRDYQLRGLQWLAFLSRHGMGACLADDMGLGKTIQFIALLLHEREQPNKPTGPTLLVVPMSLVGNWRREIEKFGPSIDVLVHHGLERLTGQAFIDAVSGVDVVVSTYGLVYRDFEHLSAVSWHRIALDEAQNIKNPAAKQSAAVRKLKSTQRVSLTGTPLENRLSELWSIIDFLNPGYLGSAGDFRRRFAVPIERNQDRDRARRLRHLIQPFVLRRMKDQPGILDELPKRLEMTVFCNLTKEQAGLYEAILQDMLGQIDGSQGMQRRGLILAALVKLKQICNHPAQFLADEGPISHRSGKCDRLTEMLDEVLAEGDRALVFTQFRTMGKLLAGHLAETLQKEILFLHGGTTQKNRDALVERFQSYDEAAPIFILSLKAGGFGLNLTAANHVFHYDRWWNPAVEAQATDRAHRIGQTQQVQVHKFVCVGTLEEKIDAMLEKKRHLADQIVGTTEKWVTELSTNALKDLFALSNDATAED